MLHSFGVVRATCVDFLYEFRDVRTKATTSVYPPPPAKTTPHSPLKLSCSCPEKLFYYVSEHEAWADKIYRRFVNLRTDYQKLEHQRDPSQPLTACQQWKLTDLSYLKTFYKQGYRSARGATSRTSTEHSSDEEADDRWPWEQLELSERYAYQNTFSQPSHTPARRPKKRRDDRTDSDKDETSSKLNEIVGVMKDSANHLGGPFTNSSTWPLGTGEGKLLPVDVWIHKPNATSELAGIPKASL